MDFTNLAVEGVLVGGASAGGVCVGGALVESGANAFADRDERGAEAPITAEEPRESRPSDARAVEPKTGENKVGEMNAREEKRAEKEEEKSEACYLDRPLRDASEWPGLGAKWAGQLQALLTRMHAMAMDGFAPSRKDFYIGTDLHPQAHKKFFPTFTEFAHRCGYRSAMEKMCDATRTELVERAAMRRMQAIKNKSDLRRGIKKRGESAFGDPLDDCDMIHAPTNEQGVVMLFGMLAKELKFVVELVQTAYPDCEAKRQGEDGKWRRVLIEFEFRSSNFNHDPRGCDLIVCWEHDTKENEVDVLELKSVMEERKAAALAKGTAVREDHAHPKPGETPQPRITRNPPAEAPAFARPYRSAAPDGCAARRVARNSKRSSVKVREKTKEPEAAKPADASAPAAVAAK